MTRSPCTRPEPSGEAPRRATDVAAPNLELVAADGIGTAADHLSVDAVHMAATTQTGGLYVEDVNGGLDVGSVGATSGASVTAGTPDDAIYTAAHSPLSISADVTNVGGGRITLVAGGHTEADDLTIQSDLATTGGGDIQLVAGSDIVFGPGQTVTTEDGSISLASDDRISLAGGISTGGGQVTVLAKAGDIYLAPTGSLVNAGLQDVQLSAGDGATLDGLINAAAGSILIRSGRGTVSLGGTVSAGAGNVEVSSLGADLMVGQGAGVSCGGEGSVNLFGSRDVIVAGNVATDGGLLLVSANGLLQVLGSLTSSQGDIGLAGLTVQRESGCAISCPGGKLGVGAAPTERAATLAALTALTAPSVSDLTTAGSPDVQEEPEKKRDGDSDDQPPAPAPAATP